MLLSKAEPPETFKLTHHSPVRYKVNGVPEKFRLYSSTGSRSASISKSQGQEKKCGSQLEKTQPSWDCFLCHSILTPLLILKTLWRSSTLQPCQDPLPPGGDHTPALSFSSSRFTTFVLKTIKPYFSAESRNSFRLLLIIANFCLRLWARACPKFNPKQWFSVLLTATNWLIYEETSATLEFFNRQGLKGQP